MRLSIRPSIGSMISFFKWGVLIAVSLLVFLIFMGLSGCQVPFFWPEDSEITKEEPFSTYVGQEYRVTNEIKAQAWNDFPNKEKILVVSLTSTPGVKNRFVSYNITLHPGQKIRILSAWRSLVLFGYTYYYLVSIPDAGLPENVPVQLSVELDGIPDPHYYESLQSNEAVKRIQ